MISFLILIALGGGFFLWQADVRQQPVQAISIPGNHPWASANRDAQGTLFSPVEGPQNPEIAWKISFEKGLSGGPVVSAGGTVYLVTLDQKIHAVQPDGAIRWSVELPNPPVGAPCLGPSGNIYVTDQRGGLTKITVDGKVSELIPGRSKVPALSGPIVSASETLFYATGADLVAVSGDGREQWRQPLPTYSQTNSLLRLTMDDQYLIYRVVFYQCIRWQPGRFPLPQSTGKSDRWRRSADLPVKPGLAGRSAAKIKAKHPPEEHQMGCALAGHHGTLPARCWNGCRRSTLDRFRQ